MKKTFKSFTEFLDDIETTEGCISTNGTVLKRINLATDKDVIALNDLVEDYKNLKIASHIRPLRDVVLVLPLDEVEMEGGLIIPESKREKPLKGRVLAVGPGKDGVAMTVKEGDMVLYARYGGIEATSDGKACLLMRETDIFAID